MMMSARPAFQAEAALQIAPQSTFRDPRQAILFFGHVLDRQDLAEIPAAANEPYRSALADTWRRAMSACARVARCVVDAFRVWRDRAAGRRHLARLDSRLLRDIGLSPVDVWRESSKSFWQP
jgi:uncharacterized protein YjiS (DUF1127 family)